MNQNSNNNNSRNNNGNNNNSNSNNDQWETNIPVTQVKYYNSMDCLISDFYTLFLPLM